MITEFGSVINQPTITTPMGLVPDMFKERKRYKIIVDEADATALDQAIIFKNNELAGMSLVKDEDIVFLSATFSGYAKRTLNYVYALKESGRKKMPAACKIVEGKR